MLFLSKCVSGINNKNISEMFLILPIIRLYLPFFKSYPVFFAPVFSNGRYAVERGKGIIRYIFLYRVVYLAYVLPKDFYANPLFKIVLKSYCHAAILSVDSFISFIHFCQ